MSFKTIAIVGNPNCGKTTLFNALTGDNQKIGNWPGVTVDKIEARIDIDKQEYLFVDLPGIYGLSANSEDEKVARDYLLSGEADLVVNVVDTANLERNLLLTVQLADMGLAMLIVLNMKDVAENRGIKVDAEALSKELGIAVIYVSAISQSSYSGLKDLIKKVANEAPKTNSICLKFDTLVSGAEKKLKSKISDYASKKGIRASWYVHKLFEGDDELEQTLVDEGILDDNYIAQIRAELEQKLDEDLDIVIADSRYSFIEKLMKSYVSRGNSKTNSDRIDNIVLNRFVGIPLFLLAMYLIFWLTMGFGGVFIDFFDISFRALFVDAPTILLRNLSSPDWLITIVASGIGGALQTLATFFPIMFVMFFMLALLEDSGYMARAAFVMDRLMRFLGLPGKAFIPMLVGFGCTVPAIMATRTLENKRDKYLTIFMTPFMSCGARLPVYALFAAAFFPSNAQVVVFALYMIGIVFAVLTGLLLKSTLFAGESVPMLMELPPYHLPRLGQLLSITFSQLKDFFLNAGKTLFMIVIFLSFFNSLGIDGSFGNEGNEGSVLAFAGKQISPVFTSLGVTEDNWPASVALISGVFAKEVIVGSLNSLYFSSNNSSVAIDSIPTSIANALGSIAVNFRALFATIIPISSQALDGSVSSQAVVLDEIKSRFHGDGKAAFAYLLFILLYVPCMAVIATMNKEVGYLFTILQIAYSTLLAWLAASLYYQVAAKHKFIYVYVALLSISILTVLLKYVFKRRVVKRL